MKFLNKNKIAVVLLAGMASLSIIGSQASTQTMGSRLDRFTAKAKAFGSKVSAGAKKVGAKAAAAGKRVAHAAAPAAKRVAASAGRVASRAANKVGDIVEDAAMNAAEQIAGDVAEAIIANTAQFSQDVANKKNVFESARTAAIRMKEVAANSAEQAGRDLLVGITDETQAAFILGVQAGAEAVADKLARKRLEDVVEEVAPEQAAQVEAEIEAQDALLEGMSEEELNALYGFVS